MNILIIIGIILFFVMGKKSPASAAAPAGTTKTTTTPTAVTAPVAVSSSTDGISDLTSTVEDDSGNIAVYVNGALVSVNGVPISMPVGPDKTIAPVARPATPQAVSAIYADDGSVGTYDPLKDVGSVTLPPVQSTGNVPQPNTAVAPNVEYYGQDTYIPGTNVKVTGKVYLATGGAPRPSDVPANADWWVITGTSMNNYGYGAPKL